jgi:hypothetical protein
MLEASVVAIRTSLSNQASKLIAKIMPAQPGPWHGVVSGSPLEYSLASLEPKLSHGGDDDGGPAMFTVGKDDDYYDFHREGGSELLIGLKCTRIEIECMRREE